MKLILFWLSAILWFCPVTAFGAQSGGTLDVTMSINPYCSVSTTPVVFSYVGNPTVWGQGQVNVNCQFVHPYVIALGAGQNKGMLTPGERAMSDGAGNYLEYVLYSDSYITRWGDTGYGNTYPYATVSDLGTGFVDIHTVFARVGVPGGVTPGSYSDVITVSINF